MGALRPCPWVGCRYDLYGDFTKVGTYRIQRYGASVADLPETCALDVADRGGLTLEDVGRYLGCTRERVRQIERDALRKLRMFFGAGFVEGLFSSDTPRHHLLDQWSNNAREHK